MDRFKGISVQSLPYNPKLTAYVFDVLARGNGDPRPDLPECQVKLTLAGLTALDPQGGEVILDCGCGTGEITAALASHCRKVIGFDISSESIRRAKWSCEQSKASNLKYYQARLENPSFLKEGDFGASVDRILMLRSLHHLPDYLKQQALLKLTTWCPRAARIVIGDIMTFEPAEDHRDAWEEVGYDGGLLDRIESASALLEMLHRAGWAAEAIHLHPLMGVVVGIKI